MDNNLLPTVFSAAINPRGGESSNAQMASCLITPLTGIIVATDSQLADWLGTTPTACSQYSLFDLVPDLKPRALENHESAGQIHLVQQYIHKHDGTISPATINITPLIGLQENYLLVSIHLTDLLDTKLLHCDAITGLPDRRALVAHRKQWQQRSGEPEHPHALLFLDLDRFKRVNDQHGHIVGDQVLAALASRWLGYIREDDLLVRYGGDEFILLLSNIRSRREVEPIAKRLRDTTEEPIIIDGKSLNISATIGVALAKDFSIGLSQLIDCADRDMYREKTS